MASRRLSVSSRGLCGAHNSAIVGGHGHAVDASAATVALCKCARRRLRGPAGANAVVRAAPGRDDRRDSDVANGVARPAALRARKESSGTGAAAHACGRIRSSVATRIERNPVICRNSDRAESGRSLCRSSAGVIVSWRAALVILVFPGVDAVTVSLGLAESSRSQTHTGSIQPVRGLQALGPHGRAHGS